MGVEIKSDEGIRKALEHNRKFTEGNKLLPPIQDLATRAPVYVSLACTHLNLAFRAIKNGTHSPVCNLRDLMDHETLKQTVLEGHKWWVLPEDLPKDMDQEEIARLKTEESMNMTLMPMILETF